MKRIFTLLSFFALSVSLYGQKNVFFKINHMLGANAFSYNMVTSNNQNNSFEISRLEYYISEIKLIYDGGQDTVLSDTYLMVKANQPVNEFLGSFNITNLESIEFGIGVDFARNHSDITLYPSGHALSFQSPSMHWGWSVGYRFVATEGTSNLGAQTWQLHALGDKNYGYVSVTTAGAQNGNDIIVALDADYIKAFDNITVDGNLNYHGEDEEAPTLLQNLQTKVFAAGSASVSIPETGAASFSIAPNPAYSSTTLTLENGDLTTSKVVVLDITGKVIYSRSLNGEKSIDLSISRPGVYMVSVLKDDHVIDSRKLIIQ